METNAVAAAFDGFQSVLTGPVVLAVPVAIVFYRSVPGTRLRYVMHGIYRLCLNLAILCCFVTVINRLFERDFLWAGMNFGFALTWIWNRWWFLKHFGDEDDFWKGMGRGFRALGRRLGPAPIRRALPQGH